MQRGQQCVGKSATGHTGGTNPTLPHHHPKANGEAAPLTKAEKEELARCEQIFAHRTKPFYEWGRVLKTIKEGRLFRESQKTFGEYCSKRWQLHRSYAHRLINAAAVVEYLLPVGDIPLPTNERQVRLLNHVNRKLVPIIWREAVRSAGDEELTADHVVAALSQIVSFPNRKRLNKVPSEALSNSRTLAKCDVRLTEREVEVLGCVAHGLANKEIAVELACSESTVRTHLENIYTKYGIHSRAHAVAIFLYSTQLP